MTSNKYLLMIILYALTISCKDKHEQATSVVNGEQIIDQKADSIGKNEKTTKKTIVFFGNSLTAGYGLDEEFSFPSLIQFRIDSFHLPYTVVNSGLSGETTSGGKNRIDWVLKQPIDIFVLELGANDVLRGQDIKMAKENLRSILKSVKSKYPSVQIVIAGMQAPANMGNSYTQDFAAIYPALANEFKASLIPFLLEGVAMNAKLNLADGKHPNAEGQKIVCNNVWKALSPLLKS